MWYDGLFEKMEILAYSKQAEKMSAYMQNRFEFLGLPKPQLKEVENPYLKVGKKHELDWNFVEICWDKSYREAQYVAIDYLSMFMKKLVAEDIERLKKLIVTKSWWETVDSIDAMVGDIIKRFPDYQGTMIEWSTSNNVWLRRVAIDFQQKYKEHTNTAILETILLNNLGSSEFFINKAIGWSLRDYSKVNPVWVRSFLDKYSNQMDKLSIREASKYL